MKAKGNTAPEFLTHLKSFFSIENTPHKYVQEQPLRSELFSSDQMEQHSKSIAASHKLSEKKTPDRLLKRLANNEKLLLEVRNLLRDSVQQNNRITPAGEWLLDNFYLIEEQIRTAKKHLPKIYSEGLPQLATGVSAGLPRVYDIVLEIISHSDGHVDIESLNHFLKAYTTVNSFLLGELWAIPIMLRLALIENLRRVSDQIARDGINRALANYWANKLIETAESDSKSLIFILADMARTNPPLERAFVAEFIRQLRGKGPILAQPLNWMEERLAELGQTSDELVQIENQVQAANQVSVSNSIGSLRLLGSIDWREFVESNSEIEEILTEDIFYSLMDFSTRDTYRQAVERIAKKSKLLESDVARIAIQLSHESAENENSEDRTTHVGYYLVDEGLTQTENRAKMRLPLDTRIKRWLGSSPFIVYLGFIILITLGLSAGIIHECEFDSPKIISEPWLFLTLVLTIIICVSQLAISLVNFISTLLVGPRLLPRMGFASGIPSDSRTLVVVPSMLTSTDDIENLVESLEVRFLANKIKNLHFGLLTDFVDAKVKELPGDEALLNLAHQKIEELNFKYGGIKSNLFYLFHRPRKWNASEGVWMGYERKRGKLAELNGLLRGNSKDCFSLIVGEQSILSSVKYVITLDSDTQLPRDSAWKIVGTMAHPLNRAVYDKQKGIVTKGYGIIQPRVAVNLPDTESTLYARMIGDEPGIDPYTRASSDVYQDLFGEGSFIGKGIYEVDIFEKVLKGKFPENRILSHDLLEGCYVRSGLLSDVQLYEKQPVRYDADVKRRLRWLRGDLQIAAWALPFAPGGDKRWHVNPLSPLSRWKIFDNIRRSVVPFAFTLFVLIGWTELQSSAIWTLVITSILILPVVISSLWDLLRKPKDLILSHHILVSGRAAGSQAIRTMFTMICLPYEAFLNIFTILKTVWRMVFLRKHLLQWTSSDFINKSKHTSLFTSYLYMWIEPLLGIIIYIYLLLEQTTALKVAVPILILWAGAPFLTWWISKPLPKQASRLNDESIIFLRKLARKTWAFFEKFVTAEENWLPPDNYQEVPVDVVAHRTSPTNIGLSLLANLTAHDFGYINSCEFIERTSRTITTLQSLERYRGHLYNWYDTKSLQPLWPRYISTVDSGNLAGHLLTLRQGIMAMSDLKIIDPKFKEGINDTLSIFIEIVSKQDVGAISKFNIACEKIFQIELLSANDALNFLDALKKNISILWATQNANSESESYWWKEKLDKQIQNLIEDIRFLAPWLNLQDVPDKFKDLPLLNSIPTLQEVARIDVSMEKEILILYTPDITLSETAWLKAFEESLTAASIHANERIVKLNHLAELCNAFADIEFDFLYDKTKHLLTVGYNVEEHRIDASYYDLLASEARLSTFVGIAQGKLPQESWFSLSRLLTNAGGRPILLSWSGSMFEYLMPLLVMPSYENTLLEQTDGAAVERQIEYGKQCGIPWGMSESCYNTVDAALNYQYRAFGVPGLGLKRGLSEDLVIAPYATVLALMVAPNKAYDNMQVMVKQGFEGKYGFYEAVDYTPTRLPRGQTNAIVQSYMAHHQGMSLLSIAFVLLDKPMQKRFEAEPQFQATLLLLQERIPKATSFFAHTTNSADIISSTSEPAVRIINTPNTVIPEVQLLSNGKYHVMVTNSGGGYSHWKDIAVTRWREDGTRDNWGTFCYIRDLETGTFWSTAFQPTQKRGKNYEATFSQGRADFRDVQEQIETHIEIVVSPEDDIEMRRLHITNLSGKRKIIDVTSYAEVVIAPAIGDALHPAFSNLFVQTEIHDEQKAIFCTRRPSSDEEKQPWMFHLLKVHGKEAEEVSFETDRMAFIGRGNSVKNPLAMQPSCAVLSGSSGSVLDPIVSIRKKIILAPEESISIDMIIGIGESQEICEHLVKKYQDKHHKDRVFELAWTHSQVVLRQINATEADAQLYTRLANSVLFISPTLRAEAGILVKNYRGQSGLWPYSISGDLPIVLLKIEDNAELDLVKQMIQAHAYWRLKGLAVDLIIWNDSHDVYRQDLQNEIAGLIASKNTDQPGGIFVRASEQISNEDRILIQTVARIIISSAEGSLADHVNRKAATRIAIPAIPIAPAQSFVPSTQKTVSVPKGLLFYNGLGGFAPDGKEYIIAVENNKLTPAPWVNVIANPNFGTVISESGQSYTWCENAHEMRLTPWENDPVCDQGGEQFYLRDEETGHCWSPMPLPKGGPTEYIIRHGFGYSIFEHEEAGIHSVMCVYVDLECSIKFTSIKLRNLSGVNRSITVTGYVEWVLGDLRAKSAMYIITEIDAESGALFAKNPYNTEFPERVAFFDAEAKNKTITCDRNEFIGRNNSVKNPAALSRIKLSGKVGPGLDPCAAIQVTSELGINEEKELIFKLGEGKNATQASALARQFRTTSSAHEAFDKVKTHWSNLVEAVQIETPDSAVNLLANGWLTYQTIASRLWARTGFYQSSGAFGFRDQLQDVISLLHIAPELTRKQILLAASRQFKEGDVQHWWHPPIGRGVRTQCSDDYLWLPYAIIRYLIGTNDTEILTESVPFLKGRLLNPGEESYYDLASQSSESATIYNHCVRAIKHGLTFGKHGLPLMGSGDWNDGMNRVGKNGQGESVWLAFFLYDILIQFVKVAHQQNDPEFASQCKVEAASLKENIDKNGWDGNWYRRAYFDDGTPLGSAKNSECQIDSIAQSWSVLSGAGNEKNTSIAMESAYNHLVAREDALIKLLSPPFDKSAVDPGYIKGYVPGVRENGGQYTHAAIWLTMAFAKSGNNERTWELLNLINPINHGKSPKDIHTYKVEPYVVAGDVYAVEPHISRGGWTWYTGSAGWMHQLIFKSFLGINQEADKLKFVPCVPITWDSFKVRYRYQNTFYQIMFIQKPGNENTKVKIDGISENSNSISLVDDGVTHQIEVVFFSGKKEIKNETTI